MFKHSCLGTLFSCFDRIKLKLTTVWQAISRPWWRIRAVTAKSIWANAGNRYTKKQRSMLEPTWSRMTLDQQISQWWIWYGWFDLCICWVFAKQFLGAKAWIFPGCIFDLVWIFFICLKDGPDNTQTSDFGPLIRTYIYFKQVLLKSLSIFFF